MRKSVKKILIVVMSIMLMLMFLATISYGAYKWDFEEFDGDTIADIADYIIKHWSDTNA